MNYLNNQQALLFGVHNHKCLTRMLVQQQLTKGKHVHELDYLMWFWVLCLCGYYPCLDVCYMWKHWGYYFESIQTRYSLKMPLLGVAWFSGYTECGQGKKESELSHQMPCEGNSFFVENLLARHFHLSEWMLNAHASAVALEEHNLEQKVTKEVVSLVFFVARLLCCMYAKCRRIDDACWVFNRLPTHDVVPWGAIILGHVKFWQGQQALDSIQ